MKNLNILSTLFLIGIFSVSAAQPIGDTIWLSSIETGSYVTVDAVDDYLKALDISEVSTAELFVVEDAGNGNIRIKALINNNYWITYPNDVSKIKANTTSADDSLAIFQWIELDSVTIQLNCIGNNQAVLPFGNKKILRSNTDLSDSSTHFKWGVAEKSVIPTPDPEAVPRIADTKYSDFDVPVINFNVVTDFGADNTGQSDATGAIQAALDAAAAQWAGIVYLPEGEYLLKSTVNIPDNVSLRGDWKRPTDEDRTVKGTILLIDHGAGTTGASTDGASVGFLLNSQASIRDLSIYYPAQTLDDPSNPIKFPWTIDAVGGFGTVRNVTLVNSYEGINEAAAGFPTAISIYGSPINVGTYTTGTLATPRYQNINFMPEFWSESGLGNVSYSDVKTAIRAEEGTAFLVGSGGGGAVYMGLRLKGYDIGLETFLGQSPRLYDFEITDCRIGMHYPEAKDHGWVIAKGRIEAEEVCLRTEYNSKYVALNSVSFSCDGHNAVEVKSGAVTLQNCTFERWGEGYAVFADRSENSLQEVDISVVGGDFVQEGKHIYLADDVHKACVVGNTTNAGSLDVENHSTSVTENIVIDTTSTHAFVKMEPVESVEDVMKVQRHVPKPPAGTSHVFNVYDYGADGTGDKDDTQEFQAALNAAGALASSSAGCVVYAPPGVYRIDGYLNVPSNVELRGCHDGGLNEEARAILGLFPDKDNPTGPPTIKLQANAGIRGFGVMRPEQKWNSNESSPDYYMTLHEYPAAIEGTDQNWAYDLLMANTYDGIDFSPGGGHRLDFVYGCTLHHLIKLGGNGEMSEVLNTQCKASSWRTMSTQKNNYPPFQNSGFGDGMPYLVGNADGLGDMGTGVVFDGNGTFRAMGHFINQSGDGLYIINGSPKINMYLCGGEGAGIGIIVNSDDDAAMDVEVVGNTYHTFQTYTNSRTSPGDTLNLINCKHYGNGAPTHVFEGSGHLVIQQDYRGVKHEAQMVLKANATGIIEGGYMDSQSDYTIRAHDNSQAKIIGTLSVRDEYSFHPDDEHKICVTSICPDDITGISGSGGGFCSAAPVADFTSDNQIIYVGDTVYYSDVSTKSPTSWSWVFEGGTPATSSEENPAVSYDTPGTYDVTLVAANINGSDTIEKANYIAVTVLPPVADFTSDNQSIYVGDTVYFSDVSTNNPTSWAWVFDGGTPPSSNEPSPSVMYDSAGTYTVTLTASNAGGSSTETKTNYVTVANTINSNSINNGLKNVQVYPNPARDKLYISNLPEDATISVFNCYGQQLILTSNKTYLNIDLLENGIYILQVHSGKSKQVFRFVKI